MGTAEIVVTAGGLLSIAGLAWFCFGPRGARRAELRGGIQEVEVMVKGEVLHELGQAFLSFNEAAMRLTKDRFADGKNATRCSTLRGSSISRSIRI